MHTTIQLPEPAAVEGPCFADINCRTAVMEKHARSFHFAARFLPPSVRESVITLYAFCRYIDDLVDEASTLSARGQARSELDHWRNWLRNGARGTSPAPALGSPLAEVMAAHRIPPRYLVELVDGVESDLNGVIVHTFQDLRHYCYQVASTVGLSMAYILGAHSPRALAAAEELGIAMQLTNILRDVGADLAMGRMYLPSQELAAFRCDARHIARLAEAGRGPDRHFRWMMHFQAERAHFQYELGLDGVPLLPRQVRLAILTAARLYRGILDEIAERRYDVLRERAATSVWVKCQHALMSAATIAIWDVGDRLSPAHEPRRVDEIRQ
ncbi:MAG: phytoene/squalene synthase family protein [Chloroflexota bacterium]